MLRATGWRIASGAAGTFQTSRQSWLMYAQPSAAPSLVDENATMGYRASNLHCV